MSVPALLEVREALDDPFHQGRKGSLDPLLDDDRRVVALGKPVGVVSPAVELDDVGVEGPPAVDWRSVDWLYHVGSPDLE